MSHVNSRMCHVEFCDFSSWDESCKLILCHMTCDGSRVNIFGSGVFSSWNPVPPETRRPRRSGSIWAFDVCLSVFSRSGGEPGSVRPEPMGFPAAVCPGPPKLIRFTAPAICPDSMHHALGGRNLLALILDQLHRLILNRRNQQRSAENISTPFTNQPSSMLLYSILFA